jgi:CHAT domain-containing protein/Tfp pilus assembly protein PilF
MRRWVMLGLVTALLVGVSGVAAGPAMPASGAPLAQQPTPPSGAALSLQADGLRREGDTLDRRGDYAGALDRYTQALALYRQAGDRAGEGITLNQIGLTYDHLGQYPPALDNLTQSLAILQAAGNRVDQGAALYNIASVYDDLGQYEQALDYYSQALAILQAVGNRSDVGDTLNAIGLVYAHQGQYQRALDNYTQALQQVRETRATLTNLGYVYDRLGQYQQALDYYTRALRLAEMASDRALEGVLLNNIGTVYDHLGQYQSALDYYTQALGIRREIGDRAHEGTTLNNIGDAYHALGQLQPALDYHSQALEVHREVGDRAGEGAALANIGTVYRDLEEYDQALDYYSQALGVLQAVGDRAGAAITRTHTARVYRDLEQYDQALAESTQALTIQQDVGDRAGEAITLAGIAGAYGDLGQDAAALDYYYQALGAWEDVRTAARLEEFKTSLAEQDVDLYTRATLLLLRLGRTEDAFDLAERARARTFLDQLGNARPALGRAADAQGLQQEQALRGEIGALDEQLRQERARPPGQQNADRIDSLSRQLAAEQRDYEALLTQLKLADPEAASLVSVAPLTLAEVQRLLDPQTTLLEYFVTPEETLAFLIRSDSFQTIPLPVGESDLRDTITQFRAFANPTDADAALGQLADWLLAPLADQLTTPIVGLVPHSILHYVPFAALPAGRGYFGDQHTLFSLPSASVLPFVQAKRKAADDQALILAESRPLGLPPLQFADVEAATIARLYGTQPLLDTAATKSALAQQGPAAQVIHLAAHGELNEEAPLFSRLFLAPGGTDDGTLTVQDVYGLDLANADLVVLSACETQLGAHSRGDDLVGLNRAFLYAGAPSVIASLWSVNDQATAVFMAAFYQHFRARASKADALQAAQTQTRAQYPHPYYWAAFVLTGDPGTSRPAS